MAEGDQPLRNTPAPVPIGTSREQQNHKNSRLAVMPLAVLLPPLGDVSTLNRISKSIERRLEDLQETSVPYGSGDGEEQARRLNEESMLNQVMIWLSVGNKEE